MKSLKPWLALLTVPALLLTGNVLAQDVPAPPASSMSPPPVSSPAPTAPAPGMLPPPASPATDSASYSTAQGELTVRSAPAPAPTIGPAPDFAQLSGGGRAITEDQASAYPALANDFIHADSNRNGSVSKSEYTHWTSQL